MEDYSLRTVRQPAANVNVSRCHGHRWSLGIVEVAKETSRHDTGILGHHRSRSGAGVGDVAPVQRLDVRIDRLDDHVRGQGERLARLEGKVDTLIATFGKRRPRRDTEALTSGCSDEPRRPAGPSTGSIAAGRRDTPSFTCASAGPAVAEV